MKSIPPAPLLATCADARAVRHKVCGLDEYFLALRLPAATRRLSFDDAIEFRTSERSSVADAILERGELTGGVARQREGAQDRGRWTRSYQSRCGLLCSVLRGRLDTCDTPSCRFGILQHFQATSPPVNTLKTLNTLNNRNTRCSSPPANFWNSISRTGRMLTPRS